MVSSVTANSNHPTLVVFCKRPKLGQGKQRLASTIGASNALAIAQAMLDCAIEDAKAWPGQAVLAVSDCRDITWAQTLVGNDIAVLSQGVGNLGERINHVDAELRAQNTTTTVFIGTDAPSLQAHHYDSVRTLLHNHAGVFSKAQDGGVTIMANALPWPDLTKLPWSEASLGEALINCCAAQGWSLECCENSYDVDTQTELLTLHRDLQDDKRPARQVLLSEIDDLLFRFKRQPTNHRTRTG